MYVLRAFLIVDNKVKLQEEFVLSRLTSVELLSYSEVSQVLICLLYTSPSPRDGLLSRMPSSA